MCAPLISGKHALLQLPLQLPLQLLQADGVASGWRRESRVAVGATGDRGGPDGDIALRRSMADIWDQRSEMSAPLMDVTRMLARLRLSSPALCDATAPTVILSNTNSQLAFARVAPDKSQVRAVATVTGRPPEALRLYLCRVEPSSLVVSHQHAVDLSGGVSGAGGDGARRYRLAAGRMELSRGVRVREEERGRH